MALFRNSLEIDAAGDFVAIAWFTAANNVPIVRVVLSTDGGMNFDDPVVISSGPTSGHVGVEIINDSAVAVSWVEPAAQDGNDINVRLVGPSGLVGPVINAGYSALVRIHPQLARVDRGLVLAWTESIRDTTRVASALVPIESARNP